MKGKPLTIAIIDDSRGDKCEGECGVDWTLDASRSAAREELRTRFGERIDLEFLDLSQYLSRPKLPGLLERIQAEGLSLPLLAIEGEPRISGYFDIRMMSDAVEAELELRYE